MKTVRCLMALIGMLIVAGCVQTRYSWDNYDQKLYNHYKNPAEYDQFVEDLKNIIEHGEDEGKVPPGIYAEYGFVLYEKGKLQEALIYFNKEQDKWPESRLLMAKLINNAQKRTKQVEKQKEELIAAPGQVKEVTK